MRSVHLLQLLLTLVLQLPTTLAHQHSASCPCEGPCVPFYETMYFGWIYTNYSEPDGPCGHRCSIASNVDACPEAIDNQALSDFFVPWQTSKQYRMCRPAAANGSACDPSDDDRDGRGQRSQDQCSTTCPRHSFYDPTWRGGNASTSIHCRCYWELEGANCDTRSSMFYISMLSQMIMFYPVPLFVALLHSALQLWQATGAAADSRVGLRDPQMWRSPAILMLTLTMAFTLLEIWTESMTGVYIMIDGYLRFENAPNATVYSTKTLMMMMIVLVTPFHWIQMVKGTHELKVQTNQLQKRRIFSLLAVCGAFLPLYYWASVDGHFLALLAVLFCMLLVTFAAYIHAYRKVQQVLTLTTFSRGRGSGLSPKAIKAKKQMKILTIKVCVIILGMMTVFSALSSRFAVVLYENTTAAFDKITTKARMPYDNPNEFISQGVGYTWGFYLGRVYLLLVLSSLAHDAAREQCQLERRRFLCPCFKCCAGQRSKQQTEHKKRQKIFQVEKQRIPEKDRISALRLRVAQAKEDAADREVVTSSPTIAKRQANTNKKKFTAHAPSPSQLELVANPRSNKPAGTNKKLPKANPDVEGAS